MDFLVLVNPSAFRGQKANYAPPTVGRKALVEGSNLLHRLFLGDGPYRCRPILSVCQALMRREIALTEYSSADVARDRRHSRSLQAASIINAKPLSQKRILPLLLARWPALSSSGLELRGRVLESE